MRLAAIIAFYALQMILHVVTNLEYYNAKVVEAFQTVLLPLDLVLAGYAVFLLLAAVGCIWRAGDPAGFNMFVNTIDNGVFNGFFGVAAHARPAAAGPRHLPRPLRPRRPRRRSRGRSRGPGAVPRAPPRVGVSGLLRAHGPRDGHLPDAAAPRAAPPVTESTPSPSPSYPALTPSLPHPFPRATPPLRLLRLRLHNDRTVR